MNFQELLTWGGTGLFVLIIVYRYFIRFRREQQVSRQRLEEARHLGIDRPRAQAPKIDPFLCIGCGSCVQACPESDVLAVVNGLATVVNGQRCVGHAKCERACPVDALAVTLGDTSSRPDIPILTKCQETTVPGIFIAGELGGLSLIRNAIDQGRGAVESIARGLESGRDKSLVDVAIIGAGPAGLTAALAAMKLGLSYILLDKGEVGGTILHYPRRKLVMTQPVDIPLYGRLTKDEYSKEDLLEIWNEIIERFSVEFRGNETVEQVRRNGEGFCVRTPKAEHHARHVILALGRRGSPRRLGVPGEESPKVVYQLADAQAYAGRHILVVGGGDSAVEAAIALARQPDTTVSISYRKSGFFRVKKKNDVLISELIKRRRIQPLFESQVECINETTVTLKTSREPVTIPNEYVVVLIGGVPPFAMLKEMGIAFGKPSGSNGEEGGGQHTSPDSSSIFSGPVDFRPWLTSDPLGKRIESFAQIAAIPDEYSLSQNYPNPFNPSTVIQFHLPAAAKARIEVFNILGQRVKLLANKEFAAGQHQITWDGTDARGRSTPSGIYLYRIVSEDFIESKKMVLLR